MLLFDDPNFVVLDKPEGVSSHSPDGGENFGFIEMASEQLGQKLLLCHRLDGGTSGCLLAAKDKETCASLSQLFENHDVQKKYIFVSDRLSKLGTQWTVRGSIEKRAGKFVFEPNPQNSNTPSKNVESSQTETHFKFLESVNNFHFFEAQPVTGKPHQIRLHAEFSGCPILGDSEHGGTQHIRLFLHHQTMTFDGKTVSSPLPKAFGLLKNSIEGKSIWHLIRDVDRKLSLGFDLRKNFDSFKLGENRGHYTVEKLADVFHILNYSDQSPEQILNELNTSMEFEKPKSPKIFSKTPPILIRSMVNRGKGTPSPTNIEFASENLPDTWLVQENGLKFEIRKDKGLSAGLFLDQRLNRKRIQKISKNKSVLNLFSYTCGFSVAAAIGGSPKTVSVDASKTYLEWGKKNFELNGIKPDGHQFFASDVLFFLKAGVKRKQTYDLIVCDPPSFGRSKEGIWSIEKNLPELFELILKSTHPGSVILFSSNHTELSPHRIKRQFDEQATKLKKEIKEYESVRCDWDYDWPQTPEHLLGFWCVLHG